jgi:cytochrome c-type biogenesis protein CcmH/NrfG
MKQEINQAQAKNFQQWVALGRCYVTANKEF